MKIYVLLSLISIVFTILISVRAKSAYDTQSKFRDDSEVKLYPVKRKTPNYEQAYYVLAHEDQPDSEYSENLHNLEGSSAQHYRRVDEPGLAPTNLQPVREYNGQPSSLFERQLDLEKQVLQNEINKRAERAAKRESDPLLVQPDETYGMVYRKGRLVGILEPYPPAFELSPLSNMREGIEEIQPLPMPTSNIRQAMDPRYANSKLSESKQPNSDWDWAKSENSRDATKFSDEKYPMILTDFKIDSKLSGNPNSYKRDNIQQSVLTGLRTGSEEKSGLMYTNSPYTEKDLQFENPAVLSKMRSSADVKRNVPSLTDEKISVLKSALDKIQNPDSADKVEEIEQDLRGILNDMGLVENENKASDLQKNKRDSDSEDRSDKRQVDKEDENLEQGANKIDIVRTSHELQKTRRETHDDNEPENEQSADQEVAENSNILEDESKVAGGSSNLKSENDVAVDSESEHKSNVLEENEGNIQNRRGVSKINIANYQSEGEAYIRSKRQELSTEVNDIMKGLEKSGELTVSGNKSPLAASGNGPEAEKHTDHCSTTMSSSGQKSGLSDSKYETDIERNIQAKIDAIKEEVKREIAALQSKNAETATDNQEIQRKKRDASTTLIDGETSAVDPQQHPEEKLLPLIRRRRNLESIEELKRTKRGLPDFSNLKNIDTNDYFELNGERHGEDPDPLMDYQMDPQENKYLPQSLQGFDEDNNNFSNSKEKRNTIAQQDDSLDGYASDLNTDKNQDNLESSDDVVKVSEKSIENSSVSDSTLLSQPNSAISSTPSIEKEEKQSYPLTKREDNVTAINNSDNIQRQTFNFTTGKPQIQENNGQNENANLVQDQQENVESLHEGNLQKRDQVSSDTTVNRDIDLKKNGEQVSQDLRDENLQKRDRINSKNLIDSVVNQHFNEQLKKLHESPSNYVVSENVDVIKNEIKSEDANSKDIQPGVNKMSRESGSSKMETAINQADSSTRETKRAIRETSLKDSITNFETKNQEDIQTFKRRRRAQERKRRQIDEGENESKPQILYTRRKRGNAVMLDGNVAYLPYRPEEEDVDDEGDEFDDDGFDDRTARQQKRDAGYNDQFRRMPDYDNIQDYEVPEGYSMNYYQPEQKSPLSRRYVAKLNSDVYENPSPGYYGNYLFPSSAYVRRKRQNFDQLVGLHGGGPMLHHLAAARERNIRHLDNLKNKQKYKQSWKAANEDNKEEPQNIADLSGVDLFGALPQSYDGELSRFKRIRRDTRNVKKEV